MGSLAQFEEVMSDFVVPEGEDGEEPSWDESGRGIVNDNEKKRSAPHQDSGVKKRAGRVIKDEKCSDVAAQRQIDAFKKSFDSWLPDGVPMPVGNRSDLPTDNSAFFHYLRSRVEDDEEILEHNKKRMYHVLEKAKSSGRTNAETCWMIVKACLWKVPRKAKGDVNETDGVRYQKKFCPVCKVELGMLIKNKDHDCPYCHDCFMESGREMKVVPRDDCKANHGPGKLKAL